MLSHIYQYLFGPKNPTQEWHCRNDSTLTFDLDSGSLNGVRIDDPLKTLQFLGTDEGGKAFRGGVLNYFSKGLAVGFSTRSNRIEEFRIIELDPFEPQFHPFPGSFILNGEKTELRTLTAQKLAHEFGECYWQNRDEDETILFYEFIGSEWQIEFDNKMRFKCITITSDQIMANEDQRKSYRVTKPWPPRN